MRTLKTISLLALSFFLTGCGVSVGNKVQAPPEPIQVAPQVIEVKVQPPPTQEPKTYLSYISSYGEGDTFEAVVSCAWDDMAKKARLLGLQVVQVSVRTPSRSLPPSKQPGKPKYSGYIDFQVACVAPTQATPPALPATEPAQLKSDNRANLNAGSTPK